MHSYVFSATFGGKLPNVQSPENYHRFFLFQQITQDGDLLFCHCRNHITVVDVDRVSIQQTIPPNLNEHNACNDDDVIDDPILSFSLSHDQNLLVSGHKSGLIKLWKWKGLYATLFQI